MKSNVLALLMADLGIANTHTMPHVNSNNLYSETQFKTLMYFSAVRDRFGTIQDARSFCREFFALCNK